MDNLVHYNPQEESPGFTVTLEKEALFWNTDEIRHTGRDRAGDAAVCCAPSERCSRALFCPSSR